MEPIYQYRAESISFKVLIIITAVLFLAMAVFTPLEGDEPVWLIWTLKTFLFFMGFAIIPVTPMVQVKAYPEYVEVQYGPTKLISFKLDNKKITKIEAVEYNGLTEFGGWGIKGGAGRWKGWTAFTSDTGKEALSIETTEKNYLLSCPNPNESMVMLKNVVGLK